MLSHGIKPESQGDSLCI